MRTLTRNDIDWEAVESDIRSCSFISIDAEFGGLNASPNSSSRSRKMDRLADRYSRAKASVSEFPIVQYGFSCFRYNSDDRSFHASTYQAYIYPTVNNVSCLSSFPDYKPLDRCFKLQSSCVEFIRSSGFDFNSWIDEGLSYLSSKEQEDAMLEPLSENSNEEVHLDRRNADFIKKFLTNLDKVTQDYVKKMATTTNAATTLEELRFAFTTEITAQSTVVPVSNNVFQFITEPLRPFQRKAIRKQLASRHPSWIVIELLVDNPGTKPHWRRKLRILFNLTENAASEIKTVLGKIQQENEITERRKLVGFTLIMDAIRSSGKPVVCHNGLYDLLQSYQTFCNADLPQSLNEFTKVFHKWCPLVFDTKHLLSVAMQNLPTVKEKMSNTTLKDAERALVDCIFHGPSIIQEDTNCGEHHQAGFDAFLTGKIFIRTLFTLGYSLEDIVPQWSDALVSQLSNRICVGYFEPYQTISFPGPTILKDRSMYVRVLNLSVIKSSHSIQETLGKVVCVSNREIELIWEGESQVVVKFPKSSHVDVLLLAARDIIAGNDSTESYTDTAKKFLSQVKLQRIEEYVELQDDGKCTAKVLNERKRKKGLE